MRGRCAFIVLALSAVSLCSAAPPRPTPLVVGWQDDLKTTAGWEPIDPPSGKADMYIAPSGALTLRLPRVPQGYPHAYQWNGVTKEASVDLSRYPVAMAYTNDLNKGSYAQIEVEERDMSGRAVRKLSAPARTKPGVTFIDVGKQWGKDVMRLQVRLIVGGKLSGAQCQYRWVRFVRREDVPRLQHYPLSVSNVILRP